MVKFKFNFRLSCLRSHPFNPEQQISKSKQHKDRIESYPCPKCGDKKLKVLLLEEGRCEWEAKVQCGGCTTQAIINNSGFHMDFNEVKPK
jgi:hypothetical protein